MANPILTTAVTETVTEDGSVVLSIAASPALADGSEYITVSVTGIPEGWLASGTGTFTPASGGGTGTWSITLAPGAALDAGPSLTPPADSDADVAQLTVTARSYTTLTGALAGTRIRSVEIITDAAADAPIVTAGDVNGLEETAIALDLSAAVADADGSESLTAIEIHGVPAGFAIQGASDVGGGTWLALPAAIASLALLPPVDFYGSVTLSFEAVASETTLSGDEPSTSNNAASTLASFTVTVQDVNDPASVALANMTVSLAEDASTAIRRKVADIVVTDDTVGSNGLTLAGDDAALLEIDGTELYLRAGAALDFESNPSLDVTVVLDDPTVGGTPDDTVDLALALTDVNEAPVITSGGGGASATISVAEGVSAVTTITASDPEGRPVSFSIVLPGAGGGVDGALFAIDSASGALAFLSPRNFEAATDAGGDNVYEVTVRATDSLGGLIDEQRLSVTVLDVNEAPSLTVFQNVAALEENTDTSAPTKIADLVVTDDALGANVVTIGGADAGKFTILDGDLYLRAGVALDYETASRLDVTVLLDDPGVGGSPDASAALAVSILDVNEAPSLALTNLVGSVAEYASEAAAIRVADIAITDDALGFQTLALTGADASLFEIVGASLYLKSGTFIEQQVNPMLDVTVSLDDATLGSGPEASQSLAITVSAVDAYLTIAGTGATDAASGTGGADQLLGRAGNDALKGYAGGDILNGEDGDDTLAGGHGKDFLLGGSGRDAFDFDSAKDSRKGGQRDVVTDFTRGEDKVDLAGIDAKKGAGNQAFKWIGKKAFSGEAGELHYVKKAGYVLVEGDVNGDGKADFQIQLDGLGALGKGDFIL